VTQPRIAVVVTCFNLGRYLTETLDSVYAQTLQDFEVVIVDDGSTEPETLDVLASCEGPRTRVIHSDNRGLPAARNLGIARSTAPYLCTVDADDKLAPTYFAKAVAILEREPSVSFVSHWLQTFGDETWDWQPTDCALPALLDANTVNGAALVRREALEAVGGFDEAMRHGCEDWALWLAMVERGLRGVIIPEALFFYRRRADSMSRVMMQNDAYLATFSQLLARHQGSYRKHAPELILRRERRIADLLRGIHDLEFEYEQSLRQQLNEAREQVAGLQKKSESANRDREVRARLEQASTTIEALRIENDEIRRQHEQSSVAWAREADAARVSQLLTEVQSATRDAAALRESMSWRITAPLRTVYGWLLKRRQPRA
jgi:glycosyltransferase involved in cell wall biosynthesis